MSLDENCQQNEREEEKQQLDAYVIVNTLAWCI